jgi:hypothetical protein
MVIMAAECCVSRNVISAELRAMFGG